MSTAFDSTSCDGTCRTLLNYAAEPAFFSAHGAWRRWLVAAIVTVLAFVPFAFVTIETQTVKGKATGSGNSFVSLPPPSETMSEELGELYSWLGMASPMSGPRPDFEYGFSRYAYPHYKVQPLDIPEFKLQTVKLPVFKAVPQVVKPSSQPSSEGLVAETWNYFGLPVNYTVESRYPVSGWYWYIDGSRALPEADTPEMPAAARAVLESEKAPLALSEFDVVFSSEFPMPRILLRKSCGNPELDRQALQILRKWMMPVWKKNNDFLAVPVRRISIDWRVP